MKRFCFLVPLMLALIFVYSCKKNSDDSSNNPPVQGVLGDVGNSWKIQVNGANDVSAEIVSKENNIRTVEVTYAKLVTKTVKFGFNGNEVVDYAYSQGDTTKPFTMVKFDANIGDSYSAEINGNYHYRQVIEKQTYFIDALNKEVETIGVYETIPEGIPSTFFGLTIRTIIWYWHPVYGLVCADVYLDDGSYIEVNFITIDL